MKTQAGRDMIAELLRRYQAGDAYAAEALVDTLSPALLAFFTRTVEEKAAAEQALNACWAEIHRVRHTYRPGSPPLAWIFAVAAHVGRRRPEVRSRRERRTWRERWLCERGRRAGRVEQETKDLLAASPLTMEEIARALGISPRRAHRIARESAA